MVDFEVYTGVYKDRLEKEGKTYVEFKNEKLVVIRPYASVPVDSPLEDDVLAHPSTDDRVTIIAADEKNQFWPCIIRLTNGEAKQLITLLYGAIGHKEKEQYHELVEP